MTSVITSEEAASVKDSAEKVKEALQEARKAQTAASGAIQQASADIQSTNNLLSSVSTGPEVVNRSEPGLTVSSVWRSGGVGDGRRGVEAEQRYAAATAAGAGCDATEGQSSERLAEHRADQPGRGQRQKGRRGGQEGQSTRGGRQRAAIRSHLNGDDLSLGAGR